MSEPAKKTRPRLLEVLSTHDVSPHVRRVRLGGAELVGLHDAWAGAHIKLFFPHEGEDVPALPRLGDDGRITWPARRPVTRTYSLHRFDLAAPWIEVEFVLHTAGGPAAQWARAAVPGARIGFAGPGGPRPMLRGAGPFLAAADLSALSALHAALEALPEGARGVCYVQVPHAHDRRAIAAPPGVQINWLVTDGRPGPSTDLVAAVCTSHLASRAEFVWLAGESGDVVAMRDHFRTQRAFPASRMYAVPYWRRQQSEEEYHAERHRIMDELADAAAT